MEQQFSSGYELSGTNVGRLWEGVFFVMQARAARALSWNCPEVAEACKHPFAFLPTYRAAVATAVSRAAMARPSSDAAHSVNSGYLNLFLPFWWEHVLLRGRLNETDAARMVKELLARKPPPAPTLPAPAPAPPAAAFAHPAPPAPRPPAPRQQAPPSAVCKPISPLIVGTDIGLNIPYGRTCACAVSTAFPGRQHRPFECPIRLHATLGNCPGWTPAGARIPAFWNGDVLTPACRAD